MPGAVLAGNSVLVIGSSWWPGSACHAAARVYRWWSPPTSGSSTTSPNSGPWTLRGSGASAASDRWQRVPLFAIDGTLSLYREGVLASSGVDRLDRRSRPCSSGSGRCGRLPIHQPGVVNGSGLASREPRAPPDPSPQLMVLPDREMATYRVDPHRVQRILRYCDLPTCGSRRRGSSLGGRRPASQRRWICTGARRRPLRDPRRFATRLLPVHGQQKHEGPDRQISMEYPALMSGKRDLNPRPSPWQLLDTFCTALHRQIRRATG